MEGLVIAKLLKPNDRTFNDATEVRVVGADGSQLGVLKYVEARKQAAEAGLDLVLVAEKAEPPVCRIMDFGKLQYEQKKNLRAQKKNNATQKVKEVKFRVNIDAHDYEFKIKHALEFLEKGYKLKATLMFRGREMAHKEIGFELMEKVLGDIGDFGIVDDRPKLIGRNIMATLSPGKGAKH
ncbi:MAG: translation initiation factor IF-3 [Victivallales bacterium]|nr:translation initiation factor IF-3 [Victivallales bacterium]